MFRGRPLHCVFVHAQNEVYIDHKFGGKFAGPRFPPLWAYTLASYTPADGSVTLELLDTRFTSPHRAPAADLYLFSGLNEDLPRMLATREAIRSLNPGVCCAVGGPICASFDRSGELHQLSDFDHICIGDGEELMPRLLGGVSGDTRLPHIVRAQRRFPMAQSRALHSELVEATIRRYYGGLVEVSRGCPFLCEFCDVRIAQDNNRAHCRPEAVIVADLDALCRRGVRRIQLVCDDLIGDPRWAEALFDRIIEWEERSGMRPSLYTWATVNLCDFPTLMRKMRLAGVDMINVGIESFSRDSLLETAKVQNAPSRRRPGSPTDPTRPCAATIDAVREIQSYGLVIAAGLIFGFDSDTEKCFDIALDGIAEAGVLTGDPHLLTALPGTPLRRRMRLAGRLRQVRSGLGIRYQTNIRYLMRRDVIIAGMLDFFRRYSEGPYQYRRLVTFFRGLHPDHFVPLRSSGYISATSVILGLLRAPALTWDYVARVAVFCSRPLNVYYAAKGTVFVARQWHVRGRLGPLQLWLLMWMNAFIKARLMSPADFDIDDVGDLVTAEHILPLGYAESSDEPIPANKVRAQLHYTTRQLQPLVERLQNSPPSSMTR